MIVMGKKELIGGLCEWAMLESPTERVYHTLPAKATLGRAVGLSGCLSAL